MKRFVSLWIMIILGISAVDAANKTHLGQKIEDHIMLTSDFVDPGEAPCGGLSFKDRAFFQVFPNGTRSESPFQLASGRLVITDVEWSVIGTALGESLLPNQTLRLSISLGDGPPVFQSELTVDADSAEGRPGKSEYATTGFVVAPGVAICPDANELTHSGFLVVRIEHIKLRGYVIGD